MLDAIQEYQQTDITKSDFVFYESIDPDALDNLFRHDANPETRLAFSVDDVRVFCWGDGGVEIRVADREDTEK